MTSETLPVYQIVEELFVIGNGFDLQCGLKTGYKDFLTYILTEKYKNNIDNNIIGSKLPIIEQYEQKLKD